MSISTPIPPLLIASASPATLPAAPAPMSMPSTAVNLFYAAVFIGFGLLVARLLGVFTPRGRIRTPDRVSARQGALPLLLVMLVGGGTWLAAQILYGGYLSAKFHQQHPGATFDFQHLGPYDLAFLSTVPALLGLALLLAGDRAARLIVRLGYAPLRLGSGIIFGVAAAFGALPLVFGCGILLQLFYQWIQFQHPAEHELLGAMKGAPPHVLIILIIGACVVAPVFEELLFRGHLQSLLGAVFTRRDPPPAEPFIEAAAPHEEASPPPQSLDGSAPVLDYAGPPAPPLNPKRYAWAAIFLTSLIFASVHPMWMAPLIFVLSLCLGYVYERTGNLWACMALHAIFNATSTWSFLHMS